MRRYPWNLLQRLGARVEAGDRSAAHRDLAAVLAIVGSDVRPSLELRKLRCAQIISFCLRGAHRAGAPSAGILAEHFRVLESLARRGAWRSAVTLMHDYLDGLVDQVQPQRRTSLQRSIAWMERDMRASLETPRSLEQYADAAGVSTAHLSRSFARLRGMTFRERLLELRIERARELLRETRLKVSVVSHRIGWRDPSQFVATFKRETGLTPMSYRSRTQNLGL